MEPAATQGPHLLPDRGEPCSSLEAQEGQLGEWTGHLRRGGLGPHDDQKGEQGEDATGR